MDGKEISLREKNARDLKKAFWEYLQKQEEKKKACGK